MRVRASPTGMVTFEKAGPRIPGGILGDLEQFTSMMCMSFKIATAVEPYVKIEKCQ